MIFIQYLIDSIKQLSNEFMLVNSLTARSHKRKDHQIEEAIDVSIDWSIRGSLSLSIIHIQSS
jgi:hypothetical protein